MAGVGPADGQEASEEDVGQGGKGTENQSGGIGKIKNDFKESSARNHTGGGVNRKEKQNHDS